MRWGTQHILSRKALSVAPHSLLPKKLFAVLCRAEKAKLTSYQPSYARIVCHLLRRRRGGAIESQLIYIIIR